MLVIRERVMAGLDRARKNGVKLGRPGLLNNGVRNVALVLKDKGVGIRETCRKLGIGCGDLLLGGERVMIIKSY